MHKYRSGYSSEEKGCMFWVAIIAFCTISTFFWMSASWVTDSAAIERYREQNPDVRNVRIIRDSGNDNWLVHEISDVTFELEVDGKMVSWRCFNGAFQEMVCRSYDDD